MNFNSLGLRTTPTRDVTRLTAANAEGHRTGHGGVAWSTSSARRAAYQPQDGADERKSRVSDFAGKFLRGEEPADAGITGGTRSLMRRVLGLNSRFVKKTKITPARDIGHA